jgi:hypothetical protein
MAQDLASLVIGLRADVATLQSDLGKANAAAKRSADGMANSFNSAFSSMESAAKSFAIGLVSSLSVGTILEIGKAAIDAADSINKMSQKIGIGVESLSALSAQAKLSNVPIDALQGGLARLARNAADAAAGSKEQAAAFSAMGLSVKDASGNLKPMDQLLGEVAGKFSGYKDSAEKTALAQKLFGKSGADLIVILNELGEQGFAEVIRAAKEYNQVIGGDQARQSEEFNDNLTRLQMSVSGFANAVLREALPALVDMTNDMADAAKTSDGYHDSAQRVADVVVEVVALLRDLGTVFAQMPADIRASADEFDHFASSVSGSNNELNKLLALLPQVKKDTSGGLFDFGGGKDGLLPGVQSTRDFFDWLNTPTEGSPLADKMGIDKLKPQLDDFNGVLKITVPNINNAADGAGKLSNHLTEIASSAGKATAPIVKAGDATKAAKERTEQYSDALRKAGSALQAIQDLAHNYANDISDIVARMGGADEAQITYNKALRDIADNYQKLLELGPPTAEAVAAVGDATKLAGEKMDLTRTFDAQRESMQRYQEELRKTQDMWGDFADAVFDAVTKSGNFLKNLLANLTSVVEQMLKEWFRTAVIGSFTGAGGGAGGGIGALASVGMASIGGGGSSDAGGATFNTGSGSSLSLFDVGKQMWGGFQSGWQSLWSGSSAYTMGPPTAAGSTSSYYGGGYQSGFGQALGVAGGIYAGYNRYQQAGGGAGGIAGGAAYGYGTYAAGAGIATAAATGSLALGFAAIPVVGWIAIAAMLIDKFSGGKLFGTKGKFNFGEQATTVDASGATVTAGYDLKGQQALFGGSTHTWKDLPVAQEAIDAANAFFGQLKSGTEASAKTFGTTVGDIVGGQFIQKFDKKGNVIGNTSTVLGQTYNEDAQHFQERLIAENELQVLDKFDTKLNDAIDKYRGDADQLYAITNDLAAAQKGFNDGLTLLALGSDQSTSALLNLAATTGQFGETIDQTLQRILQAQAQYDQFVAQFKPASDYVDDFEAALSGIHTQLLANIKQANALAVAAGAAGASEKDLANIHEYAAQQAAQAIAALEASAQSLAFSLGLTTTGSLDDVNSEIAALQAKANSGGSALQGFGKSISDVAQKATDAMNLLLGDLSPLNDQQKLQTALAGLRAGTASQEQVLQIGRRLYGSSQPYNDLFAMVRNMGGTQVANAGGLASGVSHGGLTSAEQSRLSDLLKEQAQLQATQQYQQYQTLAQQLAEISSATGDDWREVAKNMGINIADFEKGLKLNDKGTDDLIKHQQDLLDSNNENTQSLIDAIYDIGDQITVALGGTPTGHSHHDTDAGTPTTPTENRTGHSSRGRDYQTGQEMARGFRDGTIASLPRSTRSRTRA